MDHANHDEKYAKQGNKWQGLFESMPYLVLFVNAG